MDYFTDETYSEPIPVAEPLASGFNVDMIGSVVRIVGWIAGPRSGGGRPDRRIVVRCAIPEHTAAELARAIRRALEEGDGISSN